MADGDAEQDFDEVAADLALEAQESYEEKKAEQEAFLDTVAEESEVPVAETTCNIIGDYVVDVRAELDGELTDRVGDMEARLERLKNGQGHAYELTEAADEAAQMLADLVDDPEWHKEKFYAAYERTSIDGLLLMVENVFTVIKEERERQSGAAEGFRRE